MIRYVGSEIKFTMKLTTEQQINIELFKQELDTLLYNKKETKLISEIISFFQSGEQYCPEFAKVGAFLAEFNYYYDFDYVVVCHHLCQYPLTQMIKFDLSEPQDGSVLSELNTKFYKDVKIPKSDLELEFLSTLREANGKFFSRCWKKANDQTNLNKLCFVEIHDCYAGYDSETGMRLDENELDKKVANWLAQYY